MIWLAILTVIVWVNIEAPFDSKKHRVLHRFSALMRVIGFTCLGFLTNSEIFLHSFIINELVFTTLYIWWLLVIFWILFDPIYNLHGTNSFWYIGRASDLDKLARKVIGKDGRVYLAVKGLVFIVISALIFS